MNFNRRITASIIAIILLVSTLFGCRPIINLDDVSEYSGYPYVEINGGVPFFEPEEMTTIAFESYSELDVLGRCGVAYACIGVELMPTEERGEIASVTPSGWEYNGISNNNEYDFVENGYVYNRCHLIGFQLAGENDNEKNLITGTRYLNIEGMLPFENMIADYVEETENHVLYRVTPIFEGANAVAHGVLMEAYSVEDEGRGICFCIYAYNVQPGIYIHYFSGANVESGEPLPEIEPPTNSGANDNSESDGNNSSENQDSKHPNSDVVMDYVLNESSKKFHTPGKNCAESISEQNRRDFNGTRDELIREGYSPCGICKP